MANLRAAIRLIFGLLLSALGTAAFAQESNGPSGSALPTAQAVKSCMSSRRSAECLDSLFADALKKHSTLEILQLIERYEAGFLDTLAGIDKAQQGAAQKLRRYAKIYADVLRANRMCLCGMLASDYATLPKPMRERVRHFFDENERWLARVLEEGRKTGQLAFKGAPIELARMIVASLEGAMMLARSYGEPPRFDAAAERVIAELEARKSV